jgi:hypothetical protein
MKLTAPEPEALRIIVGDEAKGNGASRRIDRIIRAARAVRKRK